MTKPSPPPGRVTLVGAGPGDPGLITLRGSQALAGADVVMYDYLVNPRLVDLAPDSAERICLGRHGHSRLWKQSEVNAALVEFAKAGRNVVRLKGGDPSVFGRGAEELEVLAANGIPFEVVPGVTAAVAMASYTGIPLTHRDVASAVAFVTGQECAEKATGQAIDYQALASFPGTLVFYMGVTNAGRWTADLMAAGKPADTPAALVRRCSLGDQQTIRCTLGTISEQLSATKFRPPVLAVVGPVAALGANWSWFESRPLFAKQILVTRPVDQASELASRLEALGAQVVVQPAIEIGPPPSSANLDAALDRLGEFGWVVFSSSNGVRYFLERLEKSGSDLRRLGGAKIAAIGPGTSHELARWHLRADVVPETFRAESLAESLAPRVQGESVLLVRASRGREVLAEELAKAGARVTQVVAYQSTDVTEPDEEIAKALSLGHIDWVTVTSSAIARSLVKLFGGDLAKCKLASISPITSATLAELGFRPAAEAAEYTMAGLAAAILRAETVPNSHGDTTSDGE